MFVILSGSSGVGKNTVIKEMQKTEINLVMMPTFTTREKRVGEIEGAPYFYIAKEEFQEKIKNNELIEHEFIHNNYYGSSYTIFDDYIKTGKIIIKDIGVEGEWEGIGHCAIGYIDGDIPKPAPRKENRIYFVE